MGFMKRCSFAAAAALVLAGIISGCCGPEIAYEKKKTLPPDMREITLPKVEKDCKIRGAGTFDVVYYDVKSQPFSLEGLPFLAENNGEYYRTPMRLTRAETSYGVKNLSKHTSGAAVRFRSDAPGIVLRAELFHSYDMNHMCRMASAGFDIYCKAENGKLVYNRSIQPDAKQIYIKAVAGINPGKGVCDWVVNLPLYGGVKRIEIGIPAGYKLEAPVPHKVSKPILFYGSSITQGACASRPGMAYTSMLCRAVDAEQINWGFSGNAKGEPALAEEIAKLDLAAFVYDYDYNAPTVKHLAKTHEKFFRIIRDKNPDLPIIMISKVNGVRSSSTVARRNVILKTYNNALARGDKNVYFVDGIKFFGDEDREECTVDNVHPNDLGFYRMYKGVLPTLKKALKLQ